MKCFKIGILLLFLSSFFLKFNIICARESEDVNKMSISEITNSLSMTWRDNTQSVMSIFDKAKKEPEFRKELIDSMSERFSYETINIRSSNLTRSFRYLDASEVLMQLIKKWNETEKVTQYLEFAELRIQLLITIAQFLPEGESVLFLIKTESDETEATIVRFRATILLCASGNQKAIDHVLGVYEKAKEKFPTTLIMPLDSQNRSAPRKTESDEDGDYLSSYIEKGLLLDPNNPDTDGDGLRDGNDRNPLTRQFDGKLSEDQEIAQFILYLHTRYYSRSGSPFNFGLWIASPVDAYDGKVNPSLFNNIEFTGIDGVILQFRGQQSSKFRAIHGFGTSEISLHKMSEGEGVKEFSLMLTNGPGSLEDYKITFKKFNNVWLPVYWELHGIA